MKISNHYNNSRPQFYFLLALLAMTFILSFYILRPFLFALILALVFAVIFQPFYKTILKYSFKNEALAAFLTTIVIVVLIFTPLVLLSIQIFKEAKDLYISLSEGGGRGTIFNALSGLLDSLRQRFPGLEGFSLNFDQYIKQGLSWLLNNLGAVFSNVAKIVVASFLFLISLYYLLKDGSRLREKIIRLSPLDDADDETIINKLELAISSVIKGNFVIAFIQGTLTAIGFTIFGVPNAVLWGTAAAIVALIPSVGTSLIFIPAVIFVFTSGQIFKAFGLLAWGVLAVGLIDNFLGPRLISRGMHLHPLLILLAVLGGVSLFGPIGFILGPVILSLLFTLLDVYSYVVNKK